MRFSYLLTSLYVVAGINATPSPAPAAEARSTKSCVRPALRKEWRALTPNEKKGYLNAINCLSKRPHSSKLQPQYPRPEQALVAPGSSFLDDIVYLHMDLTHVVHNTGLFLPWHRWYINAYFEELKNQCGYTGPAPYWDYSKDVDDFEGSPIFNAADGFGGWGDPKNDYQISDGALKDLIIQYPVPHHIRRKYNPYPYLTAFPGSPRPNEHITAAFQPSVIEGVINGCVGNFDCIHNATEPPQTFHTSVHLALGGDSSGDCPQNDPLNCAGGGATFSSNEPLFFLHHSNIDRIWAAWQDANPANKNAFTGGSIESSVFNPVGLPPMLSTSSQLPTSGLFPVKAVADVMDTQGGYLCYKYV